MTEFELKYYIWIINISGFTLDITEEDYNYFFFRVSVYLAICDTVNYRYVNKFVTDPENKCAVAYCK